MYYQNQKYYLVPLTKEEVERLTELREISEKKYMFVEKKYRKYDKANELFREEDS